MHVLTDGRVWGRVPALLPPLQRRHQAGAAIACLCIHLRVDASIRVVLLVRARSLARVYSSRVAAPRRSESHDAYENAGSPSSSPAGPTAGTSRPSAPTSASSPSTSSSSRPSSTPLQAPQHPGREPRRLYGAWTFAALAGVEADASCGYGSATSPACDAGAQSLRPRAGGRKLCVGPPFRGARRPGSAIPGGARSSRGGLWDSF